MTRGPNVDYTRTARSLVAGDVVGDDQTYDRITVLSVRPPGLVDHDGRPVDGEHVCFCGQRERAKDLVTRCWPVDAGVTVHG